MTLPKHHQHRIGQIKNREAWQAAIQDTAPLAMITLGTNRTMSEEKLMEVVKRALFKLDRQRLGNTRRPEKRSALNRVCAFIMPEKVGLNAHVHMLIYSPMQKRHPGSSLVRKIDQTRMSLDFFGWNRHEYDPRLYETDRQLAPRLEKIWREMVPGGHYHARSTDDGISMGIDYSLKELPWQADRDLHFSHQFWRSDQKHIELTLPINQGLRSASILV